MKLDLIISSPAPIERTVSTGRLPTIYEVLAHCSYLQNELNISRPGEWSNTEIYGTVADILIEYYKNLDMSTIQKKTIKMKLKKIHMKCLALRKPQKVKVQNFKNSLSDIFKIQSYCDTNDATAIMDHITESTASSIGDSESRDRTYIPSAGCTPEKTPVTVSTYLKGKLNQSVIQFARLNGGQETAAEFLTAFSDDLYNNGLLPKRIVIPRSKVRSGLNSDGKKRVKALSSLILHGIYLDGKIDKDIQYDNETRRYSSKNQAFYTFVAQPSGKQFGFAPSEESTGRGIASEFVSFCEKHQIDLGDLIIIGGDGTSVNTGPKGGLFAELENILQRVLQRAVCLIHHVELPLRYIFYMYDGKTTGPNSFSGVLGKVIATDVWDLPVSENFPVINAGFPRLPHEVLKKYNRDQKVMYDLIIAIEEKGLADEEKTVDLKKIAARRIGHLHNARWITFGARLLRVYISQPPYLSEFVKEYLGRICNYTIHVYFKVFSNIKLRSSISDAPKHLFDEINWARQHCNADELEVVKRTIQNNAFMANPEAIIQAMAGDADIQ